MYVYMYIHVHTQGDINIANRRAHNGGQTVWHYECGAQRERQGPPAHTRRAVEYGHFARQEQSPEVAQLYIYIYICVCVCVCVFIYIYIHKIVSPSAHSHFRNGIMYSYLFGVIFMYDAYLRSFEVLISSTIIRAHEHTLVNAHTRTRPHKYTCTFTIPTHNAHTHTNIYMYIYM